VQKLIVSDAKTNRLYGRNVPTKYVLTDGKMLT